MAYLGGNERCYGLDRIDLDYRSETVLVTVYVGLVNSDSFCTMEGIRREYTFRLHEPLAGRSIGDRSLVL